MISLPLQTYSDATSRALNYLRRREEENIAMTECIYRQQAELVEVSPNGVLLKLRNGGGYMLAAEDLQTGRQLLDKVPSGEPVLIHGESLRPLLESKTVVPLRPMRWGSLEPPQWKAEFEIWPLDQGDLDAIPLCNPALTCRDYLARRIDCRGIYGACIDDQVGGVVGVHDYGGIGLLGVRPELRGRGIGTVLMLSQVRRELRAGHIPFLLLGKENWPLRTWLEKLGFVAAERDVFLLK